MSHPVSLLIKPASGLCNIRCAYCFYRDEQVQRETATHGLMTQETFRAIMRGAFELASGQVSIAFQGGEPTLAGLDFFREALATVDALNVRRLPVSIGFQTNGLVLDRQWCSLFKEHDMLVGVSVDGTRALHDRYRVDGSGAGTFDRVVRATKLLDREQVPYNILTVVTGDVARRARAIYADYRRRGWRWQQYIPCLDSLGDAFGADRWHLSAEAYGTFLIELFDCWHADLKRGTQPYIRQFDNWMGMLLGHAPEACDMRGTCGVQYAFEADGSCFPCDFYMLDEWCLGNVHEQSFEDFDARRSDLRFIEASLQLPEQCRSCRYARLCRGGCLRHRLERRQQLNRFCESYQRFFEARLPQMLAVARSLSR